MPNVLGTAIYELSTDDSKFVSGLAAAESKAKASGSSIASALGNAAKVAAVGLAAGVATVGVGLGSAVKVAADFEQQMDQVGAVAGATADQMKGLSDTALRIGKDTAFSASQAAQAMEELAANGVSVQDIMDGAADAAVNLAAAGGTDLATAADIASTAMSAWGLSTSDMTDVVNRLAGAANVSRFGVEDLGGAIAQGGAAAKVGGVSFQDFATSIAATAQNFSSGSDAGTSFKTFVNSLTPSTKPAIAAMQKLGLITADGSNAFFDASGKMKSMSQVTQILHDATKDLSDEQKTQALSTIFGNDALRTAAGLAQLTGDEFTKLSDTMGNTQAADVAAQRMGNLKGAFEQLKGSIETIEIEVGTQFLPVLAHLASFLADVLPGAFDAIIKALRGPFTTAVQVAQGAFSILTGNVGTGAFQISRAFTKAFGPDTAKLLSTLTTNGVQVLRVAFQTLTRVIDDLSRGDWGAIFDDLGSAIKNVLPLIGNLITALGKSLLDAVKAVDWGEVGSTILDGIGDALSGAAHLAVDLGGRLYDTISAQARSINWRDVGQTVLSGIGNAISTAAGFAVDIGGKIWGAVSDAVGRINWSDIGNAVLKGIGDAVLGATGATNWDDAVHAILFGFSTALSTAVKGAEWLAQMASNLLAALTTALNAADWQSIGQTIGVKIGQSIADSSLFNQAGQNAADGVTTGFVTGLGNNAAAFLNAASKASSDFGVGLHNGIAQGLGNITWDDVGNAIVDALSQAVNNAWSRFTANIAANNAQIEAQFQDTWNVITGIVATAVSTIVEQFQSGWGQLPQVVQDTITSIVDTISSLGDRALGAVEDFVNRVIGWFQNLYDTLVGNSIVPDMVNGIIAEIQRLPNEVPGLIADMVSSAVSSAADFASSMISSATDAASGFLDALSSLPGDVASTIGGMVSDAAGQLSDFSGNMASSAADATSGFTSGLSGLPGEAAGIIADTVGQMIGSLSGLPGEMSGIATTAMSSFAGGISSGGSAAVGAAQSIAGQVVGAVSGIGGSLYSAGLDAMSGFAGGIRDAGSAAISKAQSVAQQVIDIVHSFGNSPWPAMIESGRDAIAGLVQGMSEEEQKAVKAAADLGKAVVDTLKDAFDFANTLAGADLAKLANLDTGWFSGLHDFIQLAVSTISDLTGQWNDDAVTAIKTLSDGIKASIGALSDTFKLVSDISDKSLPDIDSVMQWIAALKQWGEHAIVSLADTADVIGPEAPAKAKAIADGITSAFGALSEGLKLATAIGGQSLPDLDKGQQLIATLKFWGEHAVQSLADTAAFLGKDAPKAAQSITDAITDSFKALTAGLDIATALGDKALPDLDSGKQLIATLKFWAEHAVASLGDTANFLGPDLPKAAESITKAVGDTFSALKDGLDFAQSIGKDALPDFDATMDVISTLKFWGEHAIQSLGDSANALGTSLIQAAQTAGTAIKDVFGGLSDALSFARDAGDDALPDVDVISQAIDTLQSFASQAVQSLGTTAQIIGTDMIEAAKGVSDGIQQTFGALGDALQFAKDAADLIKGGVSVDVPTALTDALVTLITNLTIAFDTATQQLGTDTLDRAKAFADAAGPVLDAVKPAIDILSGIADLVSSDTALSIPDRFYTAITDLITRLTTAFNDAATQLGDEALKSASAFADAVKPMFDLIDPAIKAFDALTQMGQSGEINMQTFQSAVQSVVSTLANLKTLSDGGLVDANTFAQNMQNIADALQRGASAIGTANAINAMGGLDTSNAFASGGWITEPVVGIGQVSGQRYTFAENQAEYVTPGDQMGSAMGQGIERTPLMFRLPWDESDTRVFANLVIDWFGRRRWLEATT